MLVNFIDDPALSAKEKGFVVIIERMIYDGINPTIVNIRNYCSDGEVAICSGLKRLEDLGYFSRTKSSSTGSFQYKYEITEEREIMHD